MLRTLAFALPIALMTACGSDEEIDNTDYEALDEIERTRERGEIAKAIDSRTVGAYKALKVMVRALPLETDMDTLDMNQIANASGQHQLLEGSTVNKLAMRFFPDMAQTNGAEYSISAYEYAQMARAILTLDKDMENVNEDEYPTMLQVVATGYHIIDSTHLHPDGFGWNQTKEHLVMAMVLEHTKTLPHEVGVYEMSMTDPTTLKADAFRPVAHIMKGVMLLEDGWVYLADEQFRYAIKDLESDAISFEGSAVADIFGDNVEVDVMEQELLASAYLMRSTARYQCGTDHKKEQGRADAKVAIDLQEDLGLDNELTWAIGAGVFIEEGDNAKANEYLAKLEGSSSLGDDEKQALSAIQGYLAKGDSEGALKSLHDKVFMGKLAYRYVSGHVKKMKWYQSVADTEAGKMVTGFPNMLDDEYTQFQTWKTESGAWIDDVTAEMSLDSLKAGTGEIMDDIGAGIDSLFSW